MKIGIIGSWRIGGTVGTLWAKAGHQIIFSSRNPEQLAALAQQAGNGARTGSIAEAAAFGDIILLSVPWVAIDQVLAEVGPLDSKIVIDTTNQFTPAGLQQLPDGVSASAFNAQRMPGARLVKAYNTLTAGFQAESAGRTGANRVVMPFAGEDAEAKVIVAQLITDSGFDPFDVGGWDHVPYIEPPRRPGAFYGEEWHLDTARDLLKQITGQ